MSNIYAKENDRLIILCHAQRCKVHHLLAASQNISMFISQQEKAIWSRRLQKPAHITIKSSLTCITKVDLSCGFPEFRICLSLIQVDLKSL